MFSTTQAIMAFLLLATALLTGCQINHAEPKVQYVRRAFVDPSLEVGVVELKSSGQIEWEGEQVHFDRVTAAKFRRALSGSVASHFIFEINVRSTPTDLYTKLAAWVAFCEKWQIPYTVQLWEENRTGIDRVNIGFFGHLEGYENLIVHDWRSIQLDNVKSLTQEQCQTVLQERFSQGVSSHLEITLCRNSIDPKGAESLFTFLKFLGSNPPPACGYRIRLSDELVQR